MIEEDTDELEWREEADQEWQRHPNAHRLGVMHARRYIDWVNILSGICGKVDEAHVAMGAAAQAELQVAREFGVDVEMRVVPYRPETEKKND